MQKFFDTFYWLLMLFCKALLLIMVLIVIYAVFGRFILHSTPAWGEESALICMVWFCLVSCTLGVHYNTHLRMEVIEMILPKKVIKIIDNLDQLVTLTFAVFLVYAGVRVTELSMMSILPGIGIKSAWLYASLPVTGAALLIALAEKVYLAFKGGKK